MYFSISIASCDNIVINVADTCLKGTSLVSMDVSMLAVVLVIRKDHRSLKSSAVAAFNSSNHINYSLSYA